MTFNPEIHHRRSIRLPDYDYSHPGAYFVTICTYKKELYFDDPRLAEIAQEVWNQIPNHHSVARTDEFVVMPNHIHGILWLTDGGRGRIYPARNPKGAIYGAPTLATTLLSVVVQNFKAAVTRRVRCISNVYFAWQRNYFERIIRDENEFSRIREYIQNNPMNWNSDEENPGKTP